MDNHDEDRWWKFGAILLFIIFIGWIVARGVFTFAVQVAHAQVEVSVSIPCNNLNWEHSPRCTAPVAEFWPTAYGFAGYLESGVEFTQNHYGSLMVFRMENVAWLTDGKTIVYID